MTLRIERFAGEDHLEDRLLAEFDSFQKRRGATRVQRACARELLLDALERVVDAESGWDRLSLAGCTLPRAGHDLVLWLAGTGRLAVHVRRRLLRQLQPERALPLAA